METHHLRRTARDHGNRGTGLYGLRRHGGAGMGIHDGGEWQLKGRSWELDMGGGVLWRKGRRYGKGRGRRKQRGRILGRKGDNFCSREDFAGALSFVASFSLIFFRCVSD